jgi:hypothetical protein
LVFAVRIRLVLFLRTECKEQPIYLEQNQMQGGDLATLGGHPQVGV